MYRTVVRSARQFLKAVPRAGSVVTLTNRVPVAFGRRWCGGVVAAGTLVGGVTVAACDASYSVADAPIKVYYSDGIFWRAEVIRIALFIGGVPFEDVRMSRLEARAFRIESDKVTFNALPVLEVEGGKMLSQTQAIATYAAKIGGTYPGDAWEQAKVEEAIGGCTDATNEIAKTFSLPDAEKASKRTELIAPGGRIRMFLDGIEKLAVENGQNGHCVGSSLTIADISLWRLSGWLGGGVVDGIPPGFVTTTFPAIAKIVAAVDAHPKVMEWKACHPKHYSKK